MKSEAELSDDQYEDLAFSSDTTCTVCYAEFLDPEDLNIHVKQMHSPAYPKYCQFCPKTYNNLLDYAAHVRDAHIFDLRACHFCTKVFLDGGKLKLHENKHDSTDTHSCSQCNALFRESVLLKLHEQKYHDNDEDGCFLKCMPFLSSILNMKAVLLLQTVGKKTFHCFKCNFTTANLETYKEHLERKKCAGLVCDRCSGLYKSRKSMMTHFKYTKRCLTIQEYSDEVTTICKDCNRPVHLRSMPFHLKNCSALKCINCNMVFKSIDELSVHQTKEHPLGMTLIRCQFCLKEFIGQAPLKRHIDRVHKSSFHLYKYKCLGCNNIFPHPQKLFAHFFTKHKDIEPFNCKICNKKFRIRKAFTLHIKVHHKSKGFVEFDDQYHVFFSETKSLNPFVPECVVPQELRMEGKVEKKPKPFSIRTQDLLETDADATDVEAEEDKPVKRKRAPNKIKTKRSKRTLKTEPVLIYSSDEEPLLEVRKRALKKKVHQNWSWKKNQLSKSQFTCEICNKNCYTYQNHQNHLSLHNKTLEIECVKCLDKFNSKDDLTKHMNKEHSTSKLTETLKNLLKKKKTNTQLREPVYEPQKKAEKFTLSLKKVKTIKSTTPATITPVETDLSVKNFFENFTPDVSDPSVKTDIKITSHVLITPHDISYHKEPTIKLTKFKAEPVNTATSLKMPERFKQNAHYVKTKITVKLVQQATNNLMLPDFTEHNYFDSYQDSDKDDDIPEVAQEIYLEGTEEAQAPKIVIPKMPKGYSKIHVATLQTEAPYFKIIEVDSERMVELKPGGKEPPGSQADVIDLPGGTKLVTANPLAHLMGNKALDSILEPSRNKYYKPVIKDFQGMLAQAMQKLEEPPLPRKRVKKIK